jgi:hypothetical protein
MPYHSACFWILRQMRDEAVRFEQRSPSRNQTDADPSLIAKDQAYAKAIQEAADALEEHLRLIDGEPTR